jgi:luciferase family oxidoreductase group 1
MLRLSAMDQSTAVVDRSHQASIQETIALAQHCEQLGYHRFWVSEHHNHPSIVGTAPEILMAAIAARTSRIRIGSAGVMLPHYSALKVAEQFRVLDAIAPGRIDLGVGRAPGSDGRTAMALNAGAGSAADNFPRQLKDLEAWVNGSPLDEGHPFGSIKALPQGETAPDIWMLGSSDYGAQVAAFFGLPYCYAWFITDGRGAHEALELYRNTYRPSARHPEPQSAVCIWALAAPTDEEAQHLFWSRARTRLMRDKGVWLPVEPPETAAAHTYTESDRRRLEEIRNLSVVGSQATVGRRLRAIASELKIDDLVVLTWAYDPEVRRRSYALLAAEFELTPMAAQSRPAR